MEEKENQEPIIPELDLDEYLELYGSPERQAEMDEALLWDI